MYYIFFIAYMVLGFAITLCFFCWAVKNGQFKDQQRARFLPLEEDWGRPARKALGFNRYQVFALTGLKVFGVMACASVLVYALLF